MLIAGVHMNVPLSTVKDKQPCSLTETAASDTRNVKTFNDRQQKTSIFYNGDFRTLIICNCYRRPDNWHVRKRLNRLLRFYCVVWARGSVTTEETILSLAESLPSFVRVF